MKQACLWDHHPNQETVPPLYATSESQVAGTGQQRKIWEQWGSLWQVAVKGFGQVSMLSCCPSIKIWFSLRLSFAYWVARHSSQRPQEYCHSPLPQAPDSRRDRVNCGKNLNQRLGFCQDASAFKINFLNFWIIFDFSSFSLFSFYDTVS